MQLVEEWTEVAFLLPASSLPGQLLCLQDTVNETVACVAHVYPCLVGSDVRAGLARSIAPFARTLLTMLVTSEHRAASSHSAVATRTPVKKTCSGSCTTR